MLNRGERRAWRCVPNLDRILDQIGLRAGARAPLHFNMPTVALLMLWTILRDERTFLLNALEEMGVDMWRLTCDVDALINQKKAEEQGEGLPAYHPSLAGAAVNPFVKTWLDRAEREAVILGHRYLGVEHVLLAIAAEPEPRLAEVLARHGLEYAKLYEMIPAVLAKIPPEDRQAVEDSFGPFGAGWDSRATGVPRRFSMAMMLGMMGVYAVLFAALRLAGAPAVVFLLVTVFFTGVAVGQALLFGGRFPRAASIWVGSVLLPLEALVCVLCLNLFWKARISIDGILCMSVIYIPLGAILGYLVGLVAAAMFCVLDWQEKRKQGRAPAAEPASGDPFERED